MGTSLTIQVFRRCQSYVLLTDRIKIHQSQPLAWPSDFLYILIPGCDRWILIRYVNNTQDWLKFWKRFRGFFVFQSRVSTKTVVTDDFHSPLMCSLTGKSTGPTKAWFNKFRDPCFFIFYWFGDPNSYTQKLFITLNLLPLKPKCHRVVKLSLC